MAWREGQTRFLSAEFCSSALWMTDDFLPLIIGHDLKLETVL